MQAELVTIGSYEFVSEAEVAQIHLEEEGITSFLCDAQLLNMDWLLGNAIGYVKLQVLSDQAEKARQVLSTKPAATSTDLAQNELDATT